MRQDLLDFTKNPYFIQMIHDKGTSFASIKSIFAVSLAILPFGFLLNKCQNYENFQYYHNQNITYILLFLILLYFYYCKRYALPLINKYKSKSWKSTTAKIIEIGIYKVVVSRRYGTVTKYFPAIRYIFKVNNQEYKSNQFSFDSDYVYNFSLNEDASNKYHMMNEKFSKWLKEDKVEIYYNPENPEKSVVIREFHSLRNILYIFLGAISIIAFIASIFSFACWIYWTT